ncbi:MAG: hypothetical protein AB8D78_14990 [Akkermansiaceae bacterium]
MRFVVPILIFLTATARADTARVLIDGTGCSTRQLAIKRIFEEHPQIGKVMILPRRDAPVNNQRYFIIESAGALPTKAELIKALGRRAKFYKILKVEPIQE